MKEDVWKCSVCTLENEGGTVCSGCKNSRDQQPISNENSENGKDVPKKKGVDIGLKSLSDTVA
jgi:hypothetical protein